MAKGEWREGMSNWIKDKKDRFEALSEYVNHLEKKLQKATEELREISIGVVYTADTPNTWSHSLKLQDRASKCLQALSSMNFRKPDLWW